MIISLDASSRPTSARLRRSPLSAKVAALVSPQARARIALIYPWGDDSTTLPRDTRLAKTQTVREWEDLLASDEIEDFASMLEADKDDAVKQRRSPSWLPQALSEYDKWVRTPPRSEVRLPDNATAFTPSDLESLTIEDIDDHAAFVSLLLLYFFLIPHDWT